MLFPPSPSERVSLFTPTFYIVEKLRIGEYVKISSFACHIQILSSNSHQFSQLAVFFIDAQAK